MSKYNEYKAKAALLDKVLFALWSSNVMANTWDLPHDKRMRLHFSRNEGEKQATIVYWKPNTPEPL